MCGKVFLDSFRRAQIGGKIRVDYEKGKKMVKYYMQVILHVYLFLLMVILPYYMPEGYVKLGLYKYTFFREVGVQCLFMMLPAVLMLFVRQWKNLAWSHLSVVYMYRMERAGCLGGGRVVHGFDLPTDVCGGLFCCVPLWRKN